jgi:hypothetical protein
MRSLKYACSTWVFIIAVIGVFGVSALASVDFAGEASASAAGDFNDNGTVDAADFAAWRNSVGGTTALPNDNGLGTPIGSAHYNLWKAGFGNAGGGGNTFAFEDPDIWTVTQYDPAPSVGLESTPPGADSIWFAENNPEDIVIVLNDARTGENGTQPMGTFSYGGETGTNDFNSKITLVLNNSVTLTGQERDGTGEPRPAGSRALRLGREDINPVSTAMGGTTETAPWSILLHKAGTLQYDPAVTSSASMDFSRDKPNSAGALYEISGNAVLHITGGVRLGDRDNTGTRTTPGAIFRVRGSDATINVEDYINESRLGLWDHDNDVDANNPAGVTRMKLGKFVTEFVLDADGAAPIQVNDELRLGRSEILEGNTEIGYAFLRLKLSEPTMAGSGALGSGNEIVLARFARLTSQVDLGDPTNEIEMGRFFDPDRAGMNSTGTSMLPHGGLWDGGKVRASYAGATYEWTINYFEGAGVAPDPSLDNTVVLSNLMITGTPGDLDGNGSLGASDRALLASTIATPPTIDIASAQNLFDLNADEVVDSLDLTLFDARFTLPGLTAAVPEPNTILLAAAGLLWVSRYRRRAS